MTTTHLPDEQRVTLFEDRIGPIADGFYSRGRKPGEYDERVLSSLKSYPERRADILAVTRTFTAQFASARRSFEAVFGPVSSDRPVYLLDSLGELDGGTRQLEGKNTLLFGADVIAEVHGAKDMIPFSTTSSSIFIKRRTSAGARQSGAHYGRKEWRPMSRAASIRVPTTTR